MKTNLFQLSHHSHVVLEFLQAPESGDSQLCVLNTYLKPALLGVLSLRAFMSKTKEK